MNQYLGWLSLCLAVLGGTWVGAISIGGKHIYKKSVKKKQINGCRSLIWTLVKWMCMSKILRNAANKLSWGQNEMILLSSCSMHMFTLCFHLLWPCSPLAPQNFFSRHIFKRMCATLAPGGQHICIEYDNSHDLEYSIHLLAS